MNVSTKGKEVFDREDIYLSLFRGWKREFYFSSALPPGQQLELSLAVPFPTGSDPFSAHSSTPGRE